VPFLKLTLLFFFSLAPSMLLAQPPAHHQATIDAIEKCLGKTKTAIEQGTKKSPTISCDIPFSFKEAELDAILTRSSETSTPQATKDERVGKASKSTVKTLINVRAANCQAKVRVKTALVRKAIDIKNGTLIIPPQWVNCTLTTKAKKSKQVKFSFTPTGTFENNCMKQFSPKMGEFNLDCTFCRLNLVAQTMRYWVNKLGARMAPGINRSLGKQCQT